MRLRCGSPKRGDERDIDIPHRGGEAIHGLEHVDISAGRASESIVGDSVNEDDAVDENLVCIRSAKVRR